MLLTNLFYHLVNDSDFFRIVYPHINEEYFVDKNHKIIFNKIKEYQEKYGKKPSINDIKLLIETDNSVTEKDSEDCYEFLSELKKIEKVDDIKLLVKQIESWCQSRALELAILEGVEIIQTGKSKGSIKDKIEKALAVEFDVKIGMDFFKDAPARYDKYIMEEEVIPTDIEMMNILLNGGFRKKAIHCFNGRVNIGKSAILCSLASCFLKQGRNVVYISGEMSEDMISKRIDANLLDIPVNNLNKNLDKKVYLSKIKEIFSKTQGKLIVKEYPTGSANSNHISNLLNEIKTKRGFTPEVLILDYLNIFGSSKLNANAALNSYQYVKSIAEEMRGIAVNFDLAFITATQINRSNFNNNDLDMTSTSESIGLAATMDFMAGIIQPPELFEQRKYLFKNIKSRFDSNINQVVTVGIDYEKMRLYNLENDQQEIPLSVKDKLKQNQQAIDSQNDTMDFDFN